MRQTLFEIPYEIGGVPIFGVGLLLAVWAAVSLGVVLRLAWRKELGHDSWSSVALMLLVGAAIVLLPKIFPGALPIRGYGVMLLLAVSGGVGLAAYRGQRMGVHPDVIFSLALWLFVAGMIGARLFHVIEYWESDYKKETLLATLQAVVNVPQGGLVVYGSLIGAGVAFFVFVRRHKLPGLALADLIAPSLLLGLALGRIGCLLNGCCYGGVSDLPWAVKFPAGSPPYQSQIARGIRYGFHLSANPESEPMVGDVTPGSAAAQQGLRSGDRLHSINDYELKTTAQAYWVLAQEFQAGRGLVIQTEDQRRIVVPAVIDAGHSLPVHPTQIYSAIGAALLCLFLVAYYPYRRRDGEVIALTLTIYPVMRFLIEIIRTDEPAVFGTGLSISQNVSVLILVAVVGFWFYLARRPRGSVLRPAGAA